MIDWHKIKTGLLAVITVLAVYLLYSQLSGTPNIEVERTTAVDDEARSPDHGQGQAEDSLPEEELTQVGQVGIGTLEMARFTTLDPKTKRIEREFGFEKLLHQEAEQWEIDKPYMNIYRPDLTCYITGSKGQVVLEPDMNPPNPKDATLTGNVVAHIVPTASSDIKESFIYLDDLSFVSDQSRFSTSGPVTFVSDDAQMQGRGLELIYDDQNKRLDLLRIKEIEHLQFKVAKGYSFTGGQGNAQDNNGPAEKTEAERRENYTCVFSGNVIIDAGEQFIAADRINITDIIWNERDSDTGRSPQEPELSEGGSKGTASSDFDETGRDAVKDRSEPPEDLVEVAVSCDNGLAVVPSGSRERLEKIKGFLPKGDYSAMKVLDEQQDRTTFGAGEINYSLATADVTARGISKLTFFVRDFMEQRGDGQFVPVVVTAHKAVRFSPKSDRITFEGDCTCRMVDTQEHITQTYTLSADKLIVDLADEQVSSGKTLAEISKMTAVNPDGSNARLSSIKTSKDKSLGGIELKCPRFEYDATGQVFIAKGPGVIKADNSKIPQPDKDVGRFSMQKPCYAVLRNFKTLRYYTESERIIAENPQQRIYIDYFPITGEKSEQVTVTAGRIEADLVETPEGRYRLWTLLAKEGISFQDGNKLFEGNELLYDDRRERVWARGSDERGAYFNGVIFDGIEYDLATGQVKQVEIQGPGFFTIER